MSRVRKISRNPERKNYFLVDANFLANKYLPLKYYTKADKKTQDEKQRIEKCLEWWKEIDKQLIARKARIYIPDVCIAEAFKVLAKKCYQEKIIPSSRDYSNARSKMRKDIRLSSEILKTQTRIVKIHDISTCRDIIIAVDRFFEMFMKKSKHVEIIDLILIATAKYLMDFYDIPKDNLHIITIDRRLYEGSRKITELPIAYNPLDLRDSVERIFL